MNNEEKILQILTQMQGRLDKLEQGQENLQQGQELLAQNVVALQQGQKRLEQKVDKIDKAVVRLELSHSEHIKNLYDSSSVNIDLAKQLEPRVSKLENKVDDHDMQIEFLKRSAK